MKSLLSIKDSLQSWRIDILLYLYLKIIEDNIHKKDSIDHYVTCLGKLAQKNEQIKLWLFKHKEALNQILMVAGYEIR